ncbi:MAG TPA: sensor histidine kinase [Bryobacteraceae bacterium]
MEERKRGDQERQRLVQQLALTQEEECRRIARELHDDLAQQLALHQIELEMLRRNLPLDPAQVDTRLNALVHQVAKMTHVVRDLSHRLHPSILEELGLGAALRNLVAEYERSYGNICLVNGDEYRPVPIAAASALYRITQEALRNAAKHAPGAAIAVTVCESANALDVSIRDDGPGFDPGAARTKGGLGLVSMRERAESAGGTFVIESKLGEGTTVRATIILPDPQSDGFGPAKNPGEVP